MSNSPFDAIKARYGFTLPQEYRDLSSRGLLTLNEVSHFLSFYQEGSYLWLNEMEWYSLADIAGFRFEPYHLPGFVPFAFTGGGDYWCWQSQFADELGPRIVFCPRDCEMGTVYAPNFRTALYRQILEFCRSSEGDDDFDVPALLRRWEIELAGYFQDSWRRNLLQLATTAARSKLVSSIEQAEPKLAGMGAEVRWMQPAR